MPSQTRKITLDTAALFFGKAVGLMLGVVRLNYLATYLGVANFGILNFATYFTALFQSFFDFGMSQFLTREISRNPGRSRALLGQAVLLKIAVVTAASLLVGVVTIISGFDETTNWAIALTTVTLAINGISTMFLSALQAHRRMVTVSIVNIANDVIVSAAVILLLPSFPNVKVALALTGIVTTINLAIMIRAYHKLVGTPKYEFDNAEWSRMIRGGAPMAVSALGISMYTFIGPTALKYFKGEVEVGIFSAGYRLISILTLIPTTFTQVIFPVFSDFFANAKQKLAKALADSLRVITILSIPLATGTFILAPRILDLVYGEQYAASSIVLKVTIVGNVFGYMDWIIYSFLLAINKQIFLMFTSVSVGMLAVLMSLAFIPMWGFVALPYMQASIEFLLFLILMCHLARIGYRSFHPAQFTRPLLASAVMALGVLLMDGLNLFLIITVGALIYVLMLYFLSGLGEQEMSILRRLVSLSGKER